MPNQLNNSHKKNPNVRKSVYSLFVLLAVFSIIAITPSAFADHVAATVTNAPGSSIPGCEVTADGCFIPSTVTIDVGGEVIWENADTMSHTITSGTAAEGPDGHFGSSLARSLKKAFMTQPSTKTVS